MSSSKVNKVLRQPPAVAKFKFNEGEKLLCYHGPLLYEAKCIKTQVKDRQLKYFVHYSGWNKNWDEWVPESRLLKYNDTNLQKQKELERTHVKTKKPKSTKVATRKEPAEKERPATPVQEKKVKKRENPSVPSPNSVKVETPEFPEKKKVKKCICRKEAIKEEQVRKNEVKLIIPEELKDWLLDDCDLITRQKKIVKLPARVSVEHILAEYVKYKVTTNEIKHTMYPGIVNGLRKYFNAMLGKRVLYKFERPQYQDVLTEYPNKSMSEIYGAIHLLRLFSKVGEILPKLLDSVNVSSLMAHFQDIVHLMSRHSTTFFSLCDYEVASPEYHRKAV